MHVPRRSVSEIGIRKQPNSEQRLPRVRVLRIDVSEPEALARATCTLVNVQFLLPPGKREGSWDFSSINFEFSRDQTSCEIGPHVDVAGKCGKCYVGIL